MESGPSTPGSEVPDSASSSKSNSKRVRTYLPRRPRTFPSVTRQKLEQLGHAPPTNNTTRANMSYLIDRLSSDLENFRLAAEHWQRKYTELKESSNQESVPPQHLESMEGRAEYSETSTLLNGEPYDTSAEECLSIDSNTYLESDSQVPGDVELVLDLQTRNFSNAVEASSFGAHVYGRLHSTSNPSLSLVNLNTPKIRSNVNQLIKDSTFSLVMRGMETLVAVKIDLTDHNKQYALSRWLKPDFSMENALKVWKHIFEPMDVSPVRLMFNSSSSCRIGGLEYEMDDPDLDYMDKVLAKASDDEVVDMLHYCTLMVAGMHQAVFDDPSLTDARLHLGRTCERLLREAIFSRNISLNPRIAQSLLDGLIGSLGHFSVHSMVVASVSILELSWHISTMHEHLIHPAAKLMVVLFAMLLSKSPSKMAVWKQRADAIRNDPGNERCFQVIFLGYFTEAYYALLTHNEEAALNALQVLDGKLDEMPSNENSLETWDMVAYHAVSASTSQPRVYPYSLNALPTFNQFQSNLDDPLGPFMEDFKSPSADQWFMPNLHHGDSNIHHNLPEDHVHFIDEYGEPYVLGDNLKAVIRLLVQLVRAETSLVFGDEDSCKHWVDEAERTMHSIPVDYMFQRIFLTKNIIKATCTFPTGTRTVMDEFERRMMLYDCTLLDVLAEGRPPHGGYWRTP